MKNLTTLSIPGLSLLLATGAMAGELSTNVGVMSDYVWRGVSQSGESASVSGGADFADDSGFYAGTWFGSLSDDPAFNGAEVDLYLGYAGETDAITYDVGYLYYFYPSNDDIDFGEVYGSVGFGQFTLGLNYTIHNQSANDDFGFESGDIHYYISAEQSISEEWTLSGTLASYDFDFDGTGGFGDYDYYQVQVSRGTEFGDFSFGVVDTNRAGDDLSAVFSWGLTF